MSNPVAAEYTVRSTNLATRVLGQGHWPCIFKDSSSISMTTTGSPSKALRGNKFWKVSKDLSLKSENIPKGFIKGIHAIIMAKGIKAFLPN